jgi:hypothetical protein
MAHDSILLINPTAFHLRVCIFSFFATFSSFFISLFSLPRSLPLSLSLSKDLKEEVINEGAMWPFKGG